jgi:hypothetical protein
MHRARESGDPLPSKAMGLPSLSPCPTNVAPTRPTPCTTSWCEGWSGAPSPGTTRTARPSSPASPPWRSRARGPSLPGRSSRTTPISWCAPARAPYPGACAASSPASRGTVNRRHHRVGHLFLNRYKSIVVEGAPHLLELVRYLHLNPLWAKVVPDLRTLDPYP